MTNQKIAVICFSVALLAEGAVRAAERKPLPTIADEEQLIDKASAMYRNENELARSLIAWHSLNPQAAEIPQMHADFCRNGDETFSVVSDMAMVNITLVNNKKYLAMSDEEAAVRQGKYAELRLEQADYDALESELAKAGIICPYRKPAPTQKDAEEASTSKLGVAYGVGLLIVGFLVYFLPSMIGDRKRNKWAIFTLNLLAGWTLVGWVVAMVWACTREPNEVPSTPRASAQISGYCSHCGQAVTGRYCANCGTSTGRNDLSGREVDQAQL